MHCEEGGSVMGTVGFVTKAFLACPPSLEHFVQYQLLQLYRGVTHPSAAKGKLFLQSFYLAKFTSLFP